MTIMIRYIVQPCCGVTYLTSALESETKKNMAKYKQTVKVTGSRKMWI